MTWEQYVVPLTIAGALVILLIVGAYLEHRERSPRGRARRASDQTRKTGSRRYRPDLIESGGQVIVSKRRPVARSPRCPIHGDGPCRVGTRHCPNYPRL